MERWRTLFLNAIFLLLGLGCANKGLYPIGIYSVPSSELSAVAEAGFNTVCVGSVDKAYLDLARKNGITVVTSPGSQAGRNFDVLKAQSILAELNRHPALWAWYVCDEPDFNNISPDQLRFAERTIRNFPGHKKTAIALQSGSDAWRYAPFSDVLMIDRYPVPWAPLADFSQHVRLTRLAAGPHKKVLPIIQAFDWSAAQSQISIREGLRPPTYEELRCMTYMALAERADGLFYFQYSGSKWKIAEHPQTWSALQEVITEVRQHLPLFKAEHPWCPYIVDFPDRSKMFNELHGPSINLTMLRVKKGNAFVPQGRYFLAINTTAEKVPFKFWIPVADLAQLPALNEFRALPLENGCARETFDPYEVHIYGPF